MDAHTEAQIVAAFRRFDADCNGVITKGELANVLQTLDPNGWNDEKVSLLLRAADLNVDGKIQYNEFVNWIVGKTAARQLADELNTDDIAVDGASDGTRATVADSENKTQIAAAFRRFDANCDGVISRSELATVLQSLDPESWKDEKVSMLLEVADTNADGRIQYHEFVEWVMEKTAARQLAGTLASAPVDSPAMAGHPATVDGTREAGIAAAFQQFDTNCDGVICRCELAAVLQRLDPDVWTDDKINILMQAADLNQDNRIQYNEFIAWAFESRNTSSSSSPCGFSVVPHPMGRQPCDEQAIVVSVVQMNGQALISVPLSYKDTIATLCMAASQALGGQPCRLAVGAAPLRNDMTVAEAELHDGATVSAVVTSGIVQMTCNARGAYAVIKTDGSVVTWGGADVGGDSSAVAEQLRDGVKSVVSTETAFAALKSDGAVISWGRASHGGHMGPAAKQLASGVREVFSTSEAFAALKEDGSVVTWGNLDEGAAAEQLRAGVEKIASNHLAFAALKSDGSVVTWGSGAFGGGQLGIVTGLRGGFTHTVSVADQLSGGVARLFATSSAFAALKADGSVVAWGDAGWGGDASAVVEQLSAGVSQVFSSDRAFAALKEGGSVVTWGEPDAGGESTSVAEALRGGVESVVATNEAFAALRADGSVVAWGDAGWGGDAGTAARQLDGGVRRIFATSRAFAALKCSGSVVTWGDPDAGGNSSHVARQLRSGVSCLYGTDSAFAALRTDSSVVTWGSSPRCSDADQLRGGVTGVHPSRHAFAATKLDGTVVVWGAGIEEAAVARLQPFFAPVAAG